MSDPTPTIANQLADCHEIMAGLYAAIAGKEAHASDCAISRAPAFRPGPCDCDMPARVDPVRLVAEDAVALLAHQCGKRGGCPHTDPEDCECAALRKRLA